MQVIQTLGFDNMTKYLAYMVCVLLLLASCARQDAEVKQGFQRPQPTPPSKERADAREFAREVPLFSHTNSPATLLKRNADGALLIEIQPHVYMDPLGCTMMSDDQGNTFSQMYHVIAFSLEDRHYYTIWGARFGKGPPITLRRKKAYRFLVKPYRHADFKDESVPCQIIKIWDGDKVLFEKPQKQKAQPADAPDKQ